MAAQHRAVCANYSLFCSYSGPGNCESNVTRARPVLRNSLKLDLQCSRASSCFWPYAPTNLQSGLFQARRIAGDEISLFVPVLTDRSNFSYSGIEI